MTDRPVLDEHAPSPPPARERTTPPGTGGRLLGLSWSHLLTDGAANYLPGVLPAVLVSLHEPVRMAGVLVAALAIGQALQPVVGWAGDRIGGNRLTVAGLLLSSLGGGLLGLTHALWLLILLLLMIGVGAALFHPQALSGVRSMVAGRQGLLTAAFLVGGELGRGLWPTVASVITASLGLRSLWIIAIPGLLTVPLLARVAPRLPVVPRTGRAIRWAEHARPLAVLVGYRSIRAFAIFALVTFIPIAWHLHGGTLVAGASIITTLTVVGVVGNLYGGHLTDKLGRRPVLIASSVLSAALVFPVAYLSGPAIWIAAAALGIALFSTASTTILIGQDTFPENRSMGSGIALGLANGIGALLVLVVGFWVSSTGSIVTLFTVLAGLLLASAVLTLAFPSRVMR